MKNNLILIVICFCFNEIANADSDDVRISTIVDNCKSCHSEKYEGNQYIKSLKELKKIQFIEKMNNYKTSKQNTVMKRITSVL
ncbi:MAG: hypothetical protein CMM95_00830, partial [Rickettsiales bacterium]|nr:hypothetical protein [Rickettsiales bacterium]